MIDMYEKETHGEELEKIAVAADKFLRSIRYIQNSVSLPMSVYEEQMRIKQYLQSLLQKNGYDTEYNEYRNLTEEEIEEMKRDY